MTPEDKTTLRAALRLGRAQDVRQWTHVRFRQFFKLVGRVSNVPGDGPVMRDEVLASTDWEPTETLAEARARTGDPDGTLEATARSLGDLLQWLERLLEEP